MRNILSRRSHLNRISHIVAGSLFYIILATLAAAPSEAQGFGISKMESSLYHKRPPQVYLTGTTIFAQFYSKPSLAPALLNRMQERFGNNLQMNSSRLKSVSSSAETVITCTITAVDSSSSWQTLTRSEYRETGTHTVHNDQTNMDETVTDYGYVNVDYRALVVYGQLSFEYEIRDVKTGLVLDSGKPTLPYNQNFEEGAGAPDAKGVYQYLAEQAAGYISGRLLPAKEWIKVDLPKGKLKGASETFKHGLWDQSLDELNALGALKDSRDDAYRRYSLGVVNEAKAFTFDDPVLTKQYLDQAASYYKQATQLKPKEDRFWGPRHRAELALYEYQKFIEQIRRFEERKKRLLEGPAIAQADQTTSSQVRSATADSLIITNDTVIDWVKKGVSEDYILASIKHSIASRFDLSPIGRSYLAQKGVSNRIIKAMQSPGMARNRGLSRLRLFTTIIQLLPYAVIIF